MFERWLTMQELCRTFTGTLHDPISCGTRPHGHTLGTVLTVLLVVGAGMFMILKVMGRGKGLEPALITQTVPELAARSKGKGKVSSASKFCPHCGSLRQETAKFCGQCGKGY